MKKIIIITTVDNYLNLSLSKQLNIVYSILWNAKWYTKKQPGETI